jgi:hypothetical protein
VPPGSAVVDGEEDREASARRRVALIALAGGISVVLLISALTWFHPDARLSRDPGRTIAGAATALLGIVAFALARGRSDSTRQGAATFIAILALVPLPWLAGEAMASVPASAVIAGPRALEGAATGPEAGRVFAPAGHDRTLAIRWKYAREAAWGEGTVRRASTALAGYTNLFHGIASVSSASPIGDPLSERLVGAALAGGDAARILALLNVRQVLSPFPVEARGFRPAGKVEALHRYEVAGAFGRAFLPLLSRVATDAEAFEALRSPDFDAARTALVAPPPEGMLLPPPRPSGSWAVARFLSDGPETAVLSTTASAASLLVLTRTWAPGWTARVDGASVPVLRAQLALIALVVPPGDHRVVIAYRPVSYRIGLGFSAAGLLGVLALALSGPPGGRGR